MGKGGHSLNNGQNRVGKRLPNPTFKQTPNSRRCLIFSYAGDKMQSLKKHEQEVLDLLVSDDISRRL